MKKTDFMYFNQDGIISTLNGKPMKVVNQFIYLGSNILFREIDINIHIDAIQIGIVLLSNIRKSDPSDKIKWE